LRGSPQIIRNQFESKEYLVPGHDGAEIPLNIYYKKNPGISPNRMNKVLMEVYGAYGICMERGFSIARTAAMEKGWVIADAYVRGGGEKGIDWHD
jgi:protease II